MIGWTSPRRQENPIAPNSSFRQSLLTDPWTAVNVLDDVVTYKNPRNALLFSPVVAFETARAPQGDKISTFVAGGAGIASTVGFGALATRGLRLIAPTVPVLSGPIGWVAVTVGSILFASTAGSWLRETTQRGLRYLHDHEREMRRLEFGGDFRDSANAASLRQRAIRDMSGSFSNARSFIGREGMFMHR